MGNEESGRGELRVSIASLRFANSCRCFPPQLAWATGKEKMVGGESEKEEANSKAGVWVIPMCVCGHIPIFCVFPIWSGSLRFHLL